MRYLKRATFLLTFLMLIPLSAEAHKPSDSYLTLEVVGSEVQGRWDIALRDLDYAIGLDSNDDGAITWGELRRRHDAVAALALSHFRIVSADDECPVILDSQLVTDHSDGTYAVLQFTANCSQTIEAMEVDYNLFFDLDPQHRGLLQIEHVGGTATAVLGPANNRFRLQVGDTSIWSGFFDYLREGVWHIWIGIDHILFLIALLLPAVVIYSDRRWLPVSTFPQAFRAVVKVVTAFTIAHSITLSLAAFAVVDLPSRLVESVIAASIVVAALNNIFPLVQKRIWALAFAFGLVHGLGFANVLADLGLPREALIVSLVGFNLGVEVGQLAIVAGFLPLAFVLRGWRRYPAIVIQSGSIAVALFGCVWLVERAFDIRLGFI